MTARRAVCILLVALCANGAHAAATFLVQNIDGLNEGLNDPAPFAPVGGNTATTLGQARMNVIQEAARIWGQQLTSAVPIVVEARFDPITPSCTATTGTLGSAGPMGFLNLPSGPNPNFNYPVALANAITGVDQAPGSNDISARFNSDIGLSTCLGGRPFYLGFDHVLTPVGGVTPIDLLAVVLHEFGHGLGFYSAVESDGSSLFASGRFTVYDQFGYSESLGKFWPEMSQSERAAATISNGNAVFNGANLNGKAPLLIGGLSYPGSRVRLYAPATFDDGSSLSHFDTVTAWIVAGVQGRGLLMQPFIRLNPFGLTDLTGCVFKDLGWPGARCADVLNVANNAPQAQSQSVTTNEDVPVPVTLTGADPDGAVTLNYTITTPPSKGTVTLAASMVSGGSVTVTYVPNANANGADTFAYVVSDSLAVSAPATVSVNITPVNDPPTASSLAVSTFVNMPVPVTLVGSDPDGTTPTYTVLSQPVRGTLSGAAPNLLYTPGAGLAGSDSFTYRTSDGVLTSATATVSITVSTSAPLIGLPQTVSTAEDTAVQITLSTSGGPGGNVTYVIGTQPTRGNLVAPASVVSATGVVFTYTPSLNLNGADSFTFTASNGTTQTAPATVTINVTPVNDPPVAHDQTVSVVGGESVPITLTGSDVEGAALSYTVVGSPTRGTLSGTAPNLSYTASGGFTGTDTLTFRVNDGSLSSGQATVTINITQPVVTGGGGNSGGGGAMDWSALLALGLLWLLAGREPSRCRVARAALFWGRKARLPWR